MSNEDIQTLPQPGNTEQRPRISNRSGHSSKLNSNYLAELHHELARYVVLWLGRIAIMLIVMLLLLCYYSEAEKFKMAFSGLLSALSGIIGYIAGHTSKGGAGKH